MQTHLDRPVCGDGTNAKNGHAQNEVSHTKESDRVNGPGVSNDVADSGTHENQHVRRRKKNKIPQFSV